MYKNFLKIKDSKTGKGVFTIIDIPANSPICHFKGNIYTSDNLSYSEDQILQIGPNLYLGPSGEIDDYINHSCDPNCTLHIVGNKAMLYSLYLIPINYELTFDYSTSSTTNKDNWNMKCNCNSYKCRKNISGIQYVDEKTKEEYKNKNMLPLFMKYDIFMKK